MKKEWKAYFRKEEILLWNASVGLILLAFIAFDRENYLTVAASLIGVTSLIYNAKGNPVGQLLMVVFSLMYGVISYSFAYYGEMVTYLGMTMPMAVAAWISWVKNPYEAGRAEVRVGYMKQRDILIMSILTVMVTVAFYFVLEYLHTAKLIPSTISVTTSFLAVYLTIKRSPYYAVAYAANDIVLIVLWSMASMENVRYSSVVVCFAAFFVNDVYGFISWRRMGKRQSVSSDNK